MDRLECREDPEPGQGPTKRTVSHLAGHSLRRLSGVGDSCWWNPKKLEWKHQRERKREKEKKSKSLLMNIIAEFYLY